MMISEFTREDLSERLILAGVPFSGKGESLEGFPYVRKGSQAVILEVAVGEKEDGRFQSAVPVTNERMEQWGIGKDELFDIACSNMRASYPVTCTPVDKLAEDPSLIFLPNHIEMKDILLVSNERSVEGSLAIFYQPDLLSSLCDSEQYACNTLYLVPLDHDFLVCIPDMGGGLSMEDINDIFFDYVKDFKKESGENTKTSDFCLPMVYDRETDSVTQGEEKFDLHLSEHNAMTETVDSADRLSGSVKKSVR